MASGVDVANGHACAAWPAQAQPFGFASHLRVDPLVSRDRVEEEMAKDIWDVRFIPGARYPAHRSEYRLNFTALPEPFRAIIKRYLRFLIMQRSHNKCAAAIRHLRLFVDFFRAKYPHVCDF